MTYDFTMYKKMSLKQLLDEAYKEQMAEAGVKYRRSEIEREMQRRILQMQEMAKQAKIDRESGMSDTTLDIH